MNEKNIAEKIYVKINNKIIEKKVTYYQVAKDLEMSHQNFSDQMKNLKEGRFIKLKTILKLQTYLQLELIEIKI